MKGVRRRKKLVREVDWKAEWSAVHGRAVRRKVDDGFSLMGYCRLRRGEVGLTQGELEDKIGRSRGWMSWAESNPGRVLSSDIEAMLLALGVKVVSLEV